MKSISRIISRKEAKQRGLKFYYTGKPCKRGHLAERYTTNKTCVKCSQIYAKENGEHLKKYLLDYNAKNKDSIAKNKKLYRERNRNHLDQKSKLWRYENKDQINEHKRNRYEKDADYKTSIICREMLKRTLKATNSTKDTQTYELLGYYNEQLKDSISSKFLEGMSWDSYGDWHIDHIYPVARYIKDGVECPAIINSLDNLIPMWSEHNLEKSDRTLEEYLNVRKDLVELYGRFI